MQACILVFSMCRPQPGGTHRSSSPDPAPMIPQQAAAKLARAARWWRDCDGAPVKVAKEQVRTSAASARFDDSSLGKLVCRRLLEWPRLLHTATQVFISVCVPSGRSASGWPGTRTFAGSCCHALAGCTGRASGGNGSRHRAPPCPADGQSHLSIITVAPIILPVVLRKLVVRPALLPLWLRHPVDQDESGREEGEVEQRCRRRRAKIHGTVGVVKNINALFQDRRCVASRSLIHSIVPQTFCQTGGARLLGMGGGMSKKRVPQEDKMLKMVRLVINSLSDCSVDVQ